MPKKLVMIGGFPPPYGGVSVWNKRILERIRKRGINPIVIPWYGSLPSDVSRIQPERHGRLREISGCIAAFFASPRLALEGFRFIPLSPVAIFRSLRMLDRARWAAKGLKMMGPASDELVIYASYVPNFRGLFTVYLKRLLAPSRTVMHVHGAEVLEDLVHYPNLSRHILLEADAIIVVSQYMKTRVLALGIPEEIITVIPCGQEIDRQELRQSKEDLVLFCGRLDPTKDPMTLLRAVGKVLRVLGRSVSFLFIGDGPLRATLEDQAGKEGIRDHVRFLGQVSNEIVTGYYKKARVFVLPSIREPFGMVITEALSHYVPCIVTETGGMPEIVRSGQEGFVVPQGDSEGIAECIIKLFHDQDLFDRISMNARQRSLRYDMSVVSEKLIDSLALEG
jgi:glycosyltransferase involved in cell wall biosynthesis